MEDLENAEKKIIAGLNAVNKSGAFDDPALLSQLMVRLAHANHAVGRHLAGLQGRYRIKRRTVYEAELKAHGKVTRAKEDAENAAREEEETYDHFYNLHQDTQTFINICQSHLKVLAMEAKSQL
jgi:hypothetical protein